MPNVDPRQVQNMEYLLNSLDSIDGESHCGIKLDNGSLNPVSVVPTVQNDFIIKNKNINQHKINSDIV